MLLTKFDLIEFKSEWVKVTIDKYFQAIEFSLPKQNDNSNNYKKKSNNYLKNNTRIIPITNQK